MGYRSFTIIILPEKYNHGAQASSGNLKEGHSSTVTETSMVTTKNTPESSTGNVQT